MPINTATNIPASPYPTFEDSLYLPVINVAIYMQLTDNFIERHKTRACRWQAIWRNIHISGHNFGNANNVTTLCYTTEELHVTFATG